MEDFLFVIDGFLSDYQRVYVCDELIKQLKKTFPDKKILLINKYNNSFGLDTKVDYYFYYGDGFMVGPPPEELIVKHVYNKPYVFLDTDAGIFENWMPHVGVSDHVANMYNGFIISSKIANFLGYNKVFRIEYDMLFDENELEIIKEHLKTFQNEDYLIYGRRKEGTWAAEHRSLIDLHFCGFSTKMLNGFELVLNDSEYWTLCNRLGYWGKWCEYLLSAIFDINVGSLVGSEYPGFVRERFPQSKFDRVSSSGFWENKWTDMPKICCITRDNGKTHETTQILIFYWNNDCEKMKVSVNTNFGYEKEITLNKYLWSYDLLEVKESMEFHCNVDRDGKKHYFNVKLNPEDVIKLNCRFMFR